MDYECEKGATRNFEPWREGRLKEETEEERLDRLEAEENESAMAKLETKVLDAKREMQEADALDEIRLRNARNEKMQGDQAEYLDKLLEIKEIHDAEEERQAKEDEEAAKKAFQTADGEAVRRLVDESDEDDGPLLKVAAPVKKAEVPIPTFTKTVKRKRDLGAALGIKKKAKLPV